MLSDYSIVVLKASLTNQKDTEYTHTNRYKQPYKTLNCILIHGIICQYFCVLSHNGALFKTALCLVCIYRDMISGIFPDGHNQPDAMPETNSIIIDGATIQPGSIGNEVSRHTMLHTNCHVTLSIYTINLLVLRSKCSYSTESA